MLWTPAYLHVFRVQPWQMHRYTLDEVHSMDKQIKALSDGNT